MEGDSYDGLSEEEIAAIKEDSDDQDQDHTQDQDGGTQDDDDDQHDDGDQQVDDDNADGKDDEDDSEAGDSDQSDPDTAEGEGGDSDSEEDEAGDGDHEDDSGDNADQDAGEEGQEDKAADGSADDAGSSDDAGPSADRVDIDQAYNDKVSALDKRLDEGDIDFEDYKKELVSIERERTRAVVREEMAIATAEQTWESEQAAFFAGNASIKDNRILYNAFAGEVNRLLADKAWSKKPGPDILAEAKKSITAAFGIKEDGGKSGKKDKADDDPAAKKAVQDAKRASARRAAPKTLRDVPAADKNSDAGAFDYLDKLDGRAYEEAIAKLSPEELEAYARS